MAQAKSQQGEAKGTRGARSQNREGSGRERRVSMGTPRSKLEVSGKDDNYAYRWVNDQGGRIAQAQQAGYEAVSHEEVEVGVAEDRNSDAGSGVSQVVGTKEDGKPMRAHLMRIPREYYEEDQEAKQAEVDQTDAAIRRGAVAGEPGQDNRYVPQTGIKYGRE